MPSALLMKVKAHAEKSVDELVDVPEGFRFHDLRHYHASALIVSGLDIKTVQVRVQHASGKTTIDVYGHVFPDTEDATWAAISRVITARVGGNSPSAVGLRSV